MSRKVDSTGHIIMNVRMPEKMVQDVEEVRARLNKQRSISVSMSEMLRILLRKALKSELGELQ